MISFIVIDALFQKKRNYPFFEKLMNPSFLLWTACTASKVVTLKTLKIKTKTEDENYKMETLLRTTSGSFASYRATC